MGCPQLHPVTGYILRRAAVASTGPLTRGCVPLWSDAPCAQAKNRTASLRFQGIGKNLS